MLELVRVVGDPAFARAAQVRFAAAAAPEMGPSDLPHAAPVYLVTKDFADKIHGQSFESALTDPCLNCYNQASRMT